MLKSLSVALVVCSLIVAQEKSAPHSWGSHVGPQAPDAARFDLDWGQQATLAGGHAASKNWREAHPDWTLALDPRTRLPWRAFGPGIQVASANAGQAEIEAIAPALKDQLAAASGLDPASFGFIIAARAGRMWYVDFEQRISGAPVFNGGLTMRINHDGRLVLWGGRLVRPENVVAAPTLDAEGAIRASLGHLANEGFMNADTRLAPPTTKLVVHVLDGRDRLTPTLAWLVEFPSESPIALWKIFVDATTGAVLEYWNDVRECGEHGEDDECVAHRGNPLFMVPSPAMFSGVATGTVHDGVLPQAAPVLRNFNALTINCNGTNVVTDALGMYSFNGGGATVPVTAGLDGPRVNTQNQATGGLQAVVLGHGLGGNARRPLDRHELSARRARRVLLHEPGAPEPPAAQPHRDALQLGAARASQRQRHVQRLLHDVPALDQLLSGGRRLHQHRLLRVGRRSTSTATGSPSRPTHRTASRSREAWARDSRTARAVRCSTRASSATAGKDRGRWFAT